VKRIVFAVGLLFAFGYCVGQDSGLYSVKATMIWAARKPFTSLSPDGAKAINFAPVDPSQERPTDAVVSVHAYGHEYKTDIGSWVNAEAAWAPDSKAFFVTYSDGGNVGTYRVELFYVEPTGLRVVEPIPDGGVLFVARCFTADGPNVAAIKWGADSSRVTVAVAVPPHTNCASMGTFRAFEISLKDRQVLKRYDQLDAKRLFADSIGKELQNANDDCIRHPSGCVPPGMDVEPAQAKH
jgi:hypothetical protein